VFEGMEIERREGESQAVNIRNRSYTIGALVDVPALGAEGVLFAHGSLFGGHALNVKDNRLHYVYNFVGMVEQLVVADEDLPTGQNLILSASFDKRGRRPARRRRRDAFPVARRQEGRRVQDQDAAWQVLDRRRGALRRTRRRLRRDEGLPRDRALVLHGRHDPARSGRRQRRPVRRPRARGAGDADAGMTAVLTIH
jgi:hypothetical protein